MFWKKIRHRIARYRAAPAARRCHGKSDVIAVEYDFLPKTTHFLQLENPEECVAVLREFLEQNGLL